MVEERQWDLRDLREAPTVISSIECVALCRASFDCIGITFKGSNKRCVMSYRGDPHRKLFVGNMENLNAPGRVLLREDFTELSGEAQGSFRKYFFNWTPSDF